MPNDSERTRAENAARVKAYIAQLATKIADRDALIETLKGQVGSRDAVIETVTGERDAFKATLADATATLEVMNTRIEEQHAELAALTMPPLDCAVVARFNPDDRTADVMLDGRQYRVGFHPSVTAAALTCGTHVLLSGQSRAILKIVDDADVTGTQAQLTELMEGGRTALVEDSRGEKRIVLVGQQVPADALEPDAPVMVKESVIIRRMGRSASSISLGAGSRFLLAQMPDVTFDDIGGLDAELQRLVASLENPYRAPEAYETLKRKITFSVILMGLPGNGKTMLAKAIARRQFDIHREEILKYAKGNFFAVGGTELYDKWLGVTERYLREIVAAAQKLYELTGAISTVFFDDCESFFLNRSAGLSSSNIHGAVTTQFSTLVDGIREMRGVNLIAATNRLDLMDLAVVRRFDRQVRIQPPDSPERASAVLHKLLREVPVSGSTSEQVIGMLVADIFAKSRENNLLEVIFRKDGGEEDSEIITLSQMISGKFLRDVVENAKDLAIERGLSLPENERVWTLTSDDLMRSLQTELRNKESLPNNEVTVADWFMQKGDKRVVDQVISLRDRRKSDAKRDRSIDDKVV